MKVYTGMINWADEGDIFCYSIYDDEKFDLLYQLFKILLDLKLLPEKWEPYWGTNESFYFSIGEIEDLFEDTKYIEEDDFRVLERLGVDGYDILGTLEYFLRNVVSPYNYRTHKSTFHKKLTKANLEIIEPLYIGLFSEREWNSIEPNE